MVSIAYAVRAVESVVFGSTTLTLAESVIEPLPDTAATSVSAVEEELSSDFFEQPKKTKLMIPSRMINKFVVRFILNSLKVNNQKTQNQQGLTSDVSHTERNEDYFIPIKKGKQAVFCKPTFPLKNVQCCIVWRLPYRNSIL